MAGYSDKSDSKFPLLFHYSLLIEITHRLVHR
jgi:hypothetical protein